MGPNEIYKRYLLKINRNDSNEGANVLKSLFVIDFNSQAENWLFERLDKDGDNIKLDGLDTLLEPDKELTKLTVFDDSVEFQLPDNFRRHASSFSIVDNGNCKGVKIYNFDKKSLGFTAILADKFSRPSWDFEETPFLITKNRMRVYFDGFEIKKCFSTYYRRPGLIDIAGYKRFDGNPSTNIDSDLPDMAIEEILNRMAVDATRKFQDPEGFQFNKERVTTEP